MFQVFLFSSNDASPGSVARPPLLTALIEALASIHLSPLTPDTMASDSALRKRAAAAASNSASNSAPVADIANGVTDSSKIASGASRAIMRPHAMPTEHGQEMDKLLDSHEEYEFGGPVGTLAMMLGFPPLMCEFESVLGRREKRSWLACLRPLLITRLLPHLLVVL